MSLEEALELVVGGFCLSLGVIFVVRPNTLAWLLEHSNLVWARWLARHNNTSPADGYEREVRAVRRFMPAALVIIGGVMALQAFL